MYSACFRVVVHCEQLNERNTNGDLHNFHNLGCIAVASRSSIGNADAMNTSSKAGGRIVRLVGVYDADGTVRGELAYWVGARLGRAHCPLCDITHGSVTERREWRTCRAGLPVPFDTYHRDDQPADVKAATGGRAPVVVAETKDGIAFLLDPTDLERCGGSVDRLARAIELSVQQLSLTWATQ